MRYTPEWEWNEDFLAIRQQHQWWTTHANVTISVKDEYEMSVMQVHNLLRVKDLTDGCLFYCLPVIKEN